MPSAFLLNHPMGQNYAKQRTSTRLRNRMFCTMPPSKWQPKAQMECTLQWPLSQPATSFRLGWIVQTKSAIDSNQEKVQIVTNAYPRPERQAGKLFVAPTCACGRIFSVKPDISCVEEPSPLPSPSEIQTQFVLHIQPQVANPLDGVGIVFGIEIARAECPNGPPPDAVGTPCEKGLFQWQRWGVFPRLSHTKSHVESAFEDGRIQGPSALQSQQTPAVLNDGDISHRNLINVLTQFTLNCFVLSSSAHFFQNA